MREGFLVSVLVHADPYLMRPDRCCDSRLAANLYVMFLLCRSISHEEVIQSNISLCGFLKQSSNVGRLLEDG